MKNKKILILSLIGLMTLGVTSCHRQEVDSSEVISYSSISVISADDALTSAATILWNMYKGDNGSYVYDDFELTKQVSALDGQAECSVSWSLTITSGSTTGIKLQEVLGKTSTVQGVHIGYYDNQISEDSAFTLIPTITYKGVSKTMTSILGDSYKFTRKVKKLTINTYEEYKAICEKAGSTIGTTSETAAVIKATITEITIDKKYVFLQDDSYGYLAIITNYSTYSFKVGDEVVCAGQGYKANGRYALYEPTISVAEAASPSYEKPDYVDITGTYTNAQDSKSTYFERYQSMRVCVKDVTLGSNDGTIYNFSINNKQFNMKFDTSYFYQEAEKDFIFKNYIEGMKATLSGLLVNLDGSYTLMPDNSSQAINITSSNEEKMNYIKSHFSLEGYLENYWTNTILSLPTEDLFDSTITWELLDSTNEDALNLYCGNLQAMPTLLKENEAEATATLKGTLKVGSLTYTMTYPIKVSKTLSTEN